VPCALATTTVVDVVAPTTSTAYGWLLVTSLLVTTSVLAGGASTGAEGSVTGVSVGIGVAPPTAGVLVACGALASIGVVSPVAVTAVDEEADPG